MASLGTQIGTWWQAANAALRPITDWFQDVQNAPVWIAGVAVIGLIGGVWKFLSGRAKAQRENAEKAAQKLELAQIKEMLATMMAQAAARGEPPINAETTEAFVQAAVEIGAEGDAAEREALVLLAEGKTAEAANRFETDIAQAAGQAIEKLRRKAALFAPSDTLIAKDAYERLLALSPGDLHARNALGHLLLRLGDLAGAEAAYHTVLSGAGGDQIWEAVALTNLGVIASTRGDLDAAEDYQKRAVDVFERLGAYEHIAAALGSLGVIAETRGDLDTAEDYQKLAFDVFERLGDKERMAAALGNLGNIALIRGDLDAAEDYQKRSLVLDEQLGRKEGMATALGNLGEIARIRGDLDAAEDCQKRALTLFEQLGSKAGVAAALVNLGNIGHARGDLKAAEDYQKRAFAVYEQLGSKKGVAVTLGNLGMIAVLRGDKAAARARWTEALALFEGMGAGASQGAQIARNNLAALGPN